MRQVIEKCRTFSDLQCSLGCTHDCIKAELFSQSNEVLKEKDFYTILLSELNVLSSSIGIYTSS